MKPVYKDKIAFVIQRYGIEVNGGAEQYCRQIAEYLSKQYDVSVFTTCAASHITWANDYPAGETEINGVHVLRYPTENERGHWFKLLDRLLQYRLLRCGSLEEWWLKEQGPCCPKLVEAIEKHATEYQTIFFVTYLYYPTVMGMRLNLENSVLIPTVHDETAVHFQIYDKVFSAAKAFVFNTPEEREFARSRFPDIRNKKNIIAGIGVNLPAFNQEDLPACLKNTPYLVYVGRIETGKGCAVMFEYFRRYKKSHGGDLKLVLMGKQAMEIPDDPDILYLGFVSENVRNAVMANALALTLFSRFESLSMVVLESMALGRPVLVTEHNDVLKGHCDRSNAGLYFADFEGFCTSIDILMQKDLYYDQLCKNGRNYVRENYQWDVVLLKYANTIESL